MKKQTTQKQLRVRTRAQVGWNESGWIECQMENGHDCYLTKNGAYIPMAFGDTSFVSPGMCISEAEKRNQSDLSQPYKCYQTR